MKKLLYVNGNVGKSSRTDKLSKMFLDKIKSNEFEVEEVEIKNLDIKPFDEKMIENRLKDVENRDFNKAEYDLARQFAEADYIVMSAPYWDSIFPAKFRAYLEHICVNKLTFAHTEKGDLEKLCKAKKLIYITTSGGFIGENSAIEIYIKELSRMLVIDQVKFYSAQGLDVLFDRVDEILENTLKIMEF